MKKIGSKLRNLKYALPIVVSLLFGNKLNGQYNSPINLFEHPISSEYDNLETKAERDDYVQNFLNENPHDAFHIPCQTYFDCTQFSNLLSVDGYGVFGDQSSNMFWGYDGEDLDSIHKYGGTLKYNGNGKLPILSVMIPNEGGHEMNGVYTGNNLNWESFCAIEPQTDQINVQPGEAYIPENCDLYVRGPPLENKKPINSPYLIKYEIRNGIVSEPIFEDALIDPNNAKRLIKYRDSISTDNIEKEVLNSKIKIYPDPVSVYLKIEGIREGKIGIYDISGKNLENILFNGNEIDMRKCKSGIYILKVEDSQGNICRVKVIKR